MCLCFQSCTLKETMQKENGMVGDKSHSYSFYMYCFYMYCLAAMEVIQMREFLKGLMGGLPLLPMLKINHIQTRECCCVKYSRFWPLSSIFWPEFFGYFKGFFPYALQPLIFLCISNTLWRQSHDSLPPFTLVFQIP